MSDQTHRLNKIIGNYKNHLHEKYEETTEYYKEKTANPITKVGTIPDKRDKIGNVNDKVSNTLNRILN